MSCVIHVLKIAKLSYPLHHEIFMSKRFADGSASSVPVQPVSFACHSKRPDTVTVQTAARLVSTAVMCNFWAFQMQVSSVSHKPLMFFF